MKIELKGKSLTEKKKKRNWRKRKNLSLRRQGRGGGGRSVSLSRQGSKCEVWSIVKNRRECFLFTAFSLGRGLVALEKGSVPIVLKKTKTKEEIHEKSDRTEKKSP